MTDVETTLSGILAGGPQSSREVLAAMTAKGITAKQVRRARERLGITIGRVGSGASMRSTWALPAQAQGDSLVLGNLASVQTTAVSAAAPRLSSALMLPGEAARVARRIVVFGARGLDHATASEVATILVMKRDRPGTREVSCIECQCFTWPSECTAAKFTAGPRDPRQVWACGWARHDAP